MIIASALSRVLMSAKITPQHRRNNASIDRFNSIYSGLYISIYGPI